MFGGNQVTDQDSIVALFQDSSSCPATMEAARCADAYGARPGHRIEQSDAEQAYTQARLKGLPTWVELPEEEWPESWQGMRRPARPLVPALYGHPDSGGVLGAPL